MVQTRGSAAAAAVSDRREAEAVDIRSRAQTIARQHFGWPRLSPEQLTAIEALVRGQDALAVMPTGAGKSAIYQLSAVLVDGLTLVIEPLLALQRDQLSALDRAGIPATGLNSQMGVTQRRQALERASRGELRLLYLTPEQLADPERLKAVAGLNVWQVAVDEAHCVSAWGYDFRPDYLLLGQAIEALRRPTVAALTATASPPVCDDIRQWLGMRDPVTIAAAVDGPNLPLSAMLCGDGNVRLERLTSMVAGMADNGIVYAMTRRDTESIAAMLCEAGVHARAYHAGQRKAQRADIEHQFMSGELPIVVATSAFGMGIDKADIRWVAHAGLPSSPDEYMHEIGRAGRDGDAAQILLLYEERDAARLAYQTSTNIVEDEARAVVTSMLCSHTTVTALADATGLSRSRITLIAALLERMGVVRRQARKLTLVRATTPTDAVVRQVMERVGQETRIRRSRLAMMRGYAETTACRGAYLSAYFGQPLGELCGHCDNCYTGTAQQRKPDTEPYPLNSRVRHETWGDGIVLAYESDRMTVLFDTSGYRTLSLQDVTQGSLLQPSTSR